MQQYVFTNYMQMVYYFVLQWRMLNRSIKNFGLNIFFAYPVIFILFIVISKYLFSRISYAEYIYSVIPLFIILGGDERKKNDFLISFFSNCQYIGIRLITNIFLSLPFSLYLIANNKLLTAGLLLLLVTALAFINFRKRSTFIIPTPFSRFPFEFLVGFRKTFWLLLIFYTLAVIAIVVNNFPLGLIAMIFVALTCFSYYVTPEKQFYVWVFCCTSRAFLWDKAKVALGYTTLLCLPLACLLAMGFPDQILIIFGVLSLSYVYVMLALFSKYANYPKEIILPEILIIIVSMVLIPLLLIVLPYFYMRSEKKLKTILK